MRNSVELKINQEVQSFLNDNTSFYKKDLGHGLNETRMTMINAEGQKVTCTYNSTTECFTWDLSAIETELTIKERKEQQRDLFFIGGKLRRKFYNWEINRYSPLDYSLWSVNHPSARLTVNKTGQYIVTSNDIEKAYDKKDDLLEWLMNI